MRGFDALSHIHIRKPDMGMSRAGALSTSRGPVSPSVALVPVVVIVVVAVGFSGRRDLRGKKRGTGGVPEKKGRPSQADRWSGIRFSLSQPPPHSL